MTQTAPISMNRASIIEAMFGGESVEEKEKVQESQEVQAPAGVVELTSTAELILMVDAKYVAREGQEVGEVRRAGREKLAASLGCRIADIESIAESYGTDVWERLILERRVRMGLDSAYAREVSWDRLESVVLRKLITLTESPNVNLSLAEQLAIARTANQANRHSTRKTNGGNNAMQPSDSLMEVTFQSATGAGEMQDGVLPAGNMGKITMKMTHRVRNQLERPVEVQDERLIDSVNMIDLKTVQSLDEV